jgi:hypothetical protein
MARTIITTAVAIVAGLALAAPAQAQLTVTQDARGDSAKDVDMKKVTVDHTRKRVRLKTKMYRGNGLPDEVWHVVDTQGDAVPEFIVFTVVTSEVTDKPSVRVVRVDGWPRRRDPYDRLHDGDAVSCGLHLGRRKPAERLLTVVVGRGCLRTDGEMPQRLRVSSFGTFEWGKITDKVPAWREYGRWVTAD